MDSKSFVFYESFWLNLEHLSDEEYIDVSKALIRKSLYGIEPDLPRLETSLVNQMFVNVQASKERYDKAKEDGAKGGRPKKFIPPEEWQKYRETHSQRETADHFGISVDTLQRWEKTAKPQNLTVTDTDTVTVTATVTDTDTVSISNNNKKTGSNGETSKVPVLPELGPGECWTSEPMKVRNTGQWAAYYKTADGEERCMVFGEPT